MEKDDWLLVPVHSHEWYECPLYGWLDPPILPRPSHWGPTTLICCADALVDIRRWGRRVGAPTAVAGIWNSDVNCWDLPALWSIHIALDNLTLFNIFYNRVNLEPFHGFHGFHGMFFFNQKPIENPWKLPSGATAKGSRSEFLILVDPRIQRPTRTGSRAARLGKWWKKIYKKS